MAKLERVETRSLDGGRELVVLRGERGTVEVETPRVCRTVWPAVELRAQTAGGARLEGYAAVFDREADLGAFRERIQRGAFRKALGRSQDLRALWDHDSRLVLGSVRAGTLEVSEDPRGLRFAVDLPDTSYARDLVRLIERGDVWQASFAFTVRADDWEDQDGVLVRTIVEIGELLDVSPVTYPAYRDTSVQVSSRDDTPVDDRLDGAGGGDGDAGGARRRLGALRRRAAIALIPERRAVLAFQDLPLADRDRSWDAASAEARVRKWANAMDGPNARYARAFLWHRDGNDSDGDGYPDNFGDYKLPYADVISGRLTAVPRALFAVAQVLQGGRGGADIPADDLPRLRAHVSRYYARMREQFEDPSLVPPWERD